MILPAQHHGIKDGWLRWAGISTSPSPPISSFTEALKHLSSGHHLAFIWLMCEPGSGPSLPEARKPGKSKPGPAPRLCFSQNGLCFSFHFFLKVTTGCDVGSLDGEVPGEDC